LAELTPQTLPAGRRQAGYDFVVMAWIPSTTARMQNAPAMIATPYPMERTAACSLDCPRETPSSRMPKATATPAPPANDARMIFHSADVSMMGRRRSASRRS
jgi:hypothetical protein